MKCFVDDGSNFEVNALFNREPMKFDKSRSDVIRTFYGGENGAGK